MDVAKEKRARPPLQSRPSLTRINRAGQMGRGGNGEGSILRYSIFFFLKSTSIAECICARGWRREEEIWRKRVELSNRGRSCRKWAGGAGVERCRTRFLDRQRGGMEKCPGVLVSVEYRHSRSIKVRRTASLGFQRLSQPTLCGLQRAQDRRFRLYVLRIV